MSCGLLWVRMYKDPVVLVLVVVMLTYCHVPVPVNVLIVLCICILIVAPVGAYTHAPNVYVVVGSIVVCIFIPCGTPAPLVSIFRLLVPVCACSVDDVSVTVLYGMNPSVFWSVSVPVCWLGVSSSGFSLLVPSVNSLRLDAL